MTMRQRGLPVESELNNIIFQQCIDLFPYFFLMNKRKSILFGVNGDFIYSFNRMLGWCLWNSIYRLEGKTGKGIL